MCCACYLSLLFKGQSVRKAACKHPSRAWLHSIIHLCLVKSKITCSALVTVLNSQHCLSGHTGAHWSPLSVSLEGQLQDKEQATSHDAKEQRQGQCLQASTSVIIQVNLGHKKGKAHALVSMSFSIWHELDVQLYRAALQVHRLARNGQGHLLQQRPTEEPRSQHNASLH